MVHVISCLLAGDMTHQSISRHFLKNILPWTAFIHRKAGYINRETARTCFWSYKEWLSDKTVQLLERPSRVPDLNPIENLRMIVARGIYGDARYFGNVEELKESSIESWSQITQKTL